ncbi:MAG: XRE family transcriptional regulator [Actinomycetaceae bacterium]|nr:XRE family transcriptional regulator [Actinomycetaceae bacterium]
MQDSDTPLRGERLTVIQDLWELSQTELSKTLNISQSLLSKIAKRERALTPEIAARACQQFNLPFSFFAVETPLEVSGVVTFRRGSKTTVRQNERVKALLREATRAWAETSKASNYREATLPDPTLSTQEAAEWVRETDGLAPHAPIKNTVRLLERLGVGVITQLDQTQERSSTVSKTHAGASIPASQNVRPLVALINPLPGAVARLTLAHELGHLIYDQDRTHQIDGTRSIEEQRAFDFGMRLLVPNDYLARKINENTPLKEFLPLKARFGVSVRALVTHAKKTGLISPARERSLYIQMSALGWNKEEPVAVATEKPMLFAQAATRVWPANTTDNMSNDLGIPRDLADLWLNYDEKKSQEATVLNLNEYRAKRRLSSI